MRKALIVLSGGLDSTVVLYNAIDKGYDCEAVSFNYLQRHSIELARAGLVCAELGIPHHIIDIPFLHAMASSSLTHGKETPHGHYEEASMKDTVVAGRNLIMASIALSYCVKIKANFLFLGIHAGDHAIYADCRPEFAWALASVGVVFDDHKVSVHTPFLHFTKGGIVKRGIELSVPFENTWTCYDPQDEKACGKCGSCQERLEAFTENDTADPMEYVNV